MRELNIAGIDLNLLPALEALLRLRNVTAAAAEVGLSQPAMSRALARLRVLLADPLLVRRGRAYALTARAQALQPRLDAAMLQLRDLFERRAFSPAGERRTIRIAATDVHAVLLLPRLMARLAAEAPGIDIRVVPYTPDIVARLETGTLDFAFALASTPLPPGTSSEAVGEDALALVMRQGHPAAGRPWTLADYGAWPQAAVTIFGDGQSEIDAELAAAGVTRRIAVATPHFTAALAIVAATDMVTTLSAALARRFAAPFGLVLRDPPLPENRMRMRLVCSQLRAREPVTLWFRSLVRDSWAEATGGTSAPASSETTLC